MASILASIAGGYALDKLGKALGLAEGGRVPKTAMYMLHKGEVVVPAKIVNKQVKVAKIAKPRGLTKAGKVRKKPGPKKGTRKSNVLFPNSQFGTGRKKPGPKPKIKKPTKANLKKAKVIIKTINRDNLNMLRRKR